MNIPARSAGLLLQTDCQGCIEEVLQNDVAVPDLHAGRTLQSLVDPDSRAKVSHFLAQLRSERVAMGWDLNLPILANLLTLHFAGAAAEDHLFLYGCPSPSGLRGFCEAILQHQGAQADSMRTHLLEEAVPAIDRGNTDTRFLVELTKLNNQLINTQRELAGKHAELRRLNTRIEAALAAAEARFQAAAEASLDQIYIFQAVDDAQGGPVDFRLQECNSRAAAALARTRDQALGQTLRQLPPLAWMLEDFDRYMQVIRGGAPLQEERALGDVWIQQQAVAVPNGLAITVRDITGLKRIQAELTVARDAAQAANLAKDLFLATLSHELRTPLTPLLALLSSIDANPALAPGLREDLLMIHGNIELAVHLINDILDLTRLNHGKMRLDLQSIHVHRLLIDSVAMVRCAAQARHLTLDLQLEARHDCVTGDPARLQQVFWNLLQNAMKFTPPEGRIVVRTFDDPHGQLVIQVQDSGMGIPPEMLLRIFTAFEQGETSTVRRFGGVGLGLAISKSILDLHAGTITAASEGCDRGATFTITLPSYAAAEQPPPLPAVTTPPPCALRILFVEDDPLTLRVMQRLLAASGHQVTTAASVREALAHAAREPFDLLISDIGLPDGSGMDVMRQVKDHVQGIALSGYGMEEDIRHSLEAGFTRHLTKPINMPLLESTIAQMTNR